MILVFLINDCFFAGELDKKKTNHPSVIDIFTKEHRADSSQHYGDACANLPSFDVTVTIPEIPEEVSKEDEDEDSDGAQKKSNDKNCHA